MKLMTAGYMQKDMMTPTEIDRNQFLKMVKKTFSDVLIPIEYVSTQDLLGKGKLYNIYVWLASSFDLMYIGAFGVVHKGEFIDSDGSMMPIAIKTIKCK